MTRARYGFEPERFVMTAQHLALLRRANVGWEGCEYGAPSIDCKRPYGNGDVERDIAEILGDPLVNDRWGEPVVTEDQATRYRALHLETETALQIVLATGRFEPGTYEAERYTRAWKRVGD